MFDIILTANLEIVVDVIKYTLSSWGAVSARNSLCFAFTGLSFVMTYKIAITQFIN